MIGCSSSLPQDLSPELPPSFSGNGREVTPDAWWRSFDDATLDRLEATALADNFSLESSWQRLQQAEKVVERTASGLLPSVDASSSAELFRGTGFNGGNPSTEQFGIGLSAGYEVDLWGRIRSQVDAERMRARGRLADYRAAALTVSAEVAQTWYALVAARAQVGLIREQIDTNEKVSRQLKVRLGEGQGRSVDVLRQLQLVRESREQLAGAEAEVGVLENRLQVLLGRAPGKGIPHGDFPRFPATPATGVPASLIRRRPDVLRAYYEVRAANADLATAISNRFPRLSLGLTATSDENNFTRIIDDWLGTLSADLLAPLVDGGRRVAELERVEARRAELLADYRQAVLVALREVEDALVRERGQQTRLNELERQLELSRRSYSQLLKEYLNGNGGFIDVLTAMSGQQQIERDRIVARRDLFAVRIGLHRALAGGFSTPREP
jgi:NodT family efflux transporter outer membrane factor (OMF) lipoprotein